VTGRFTAANLALRMSGVGRRRVLGELIMSPLTSRLRRIAWQPAAGGRQHWGPAQPV